jgi:hypothetical protein
LLGDCTENLQAIVEIGRTLIIQMIHPTRILLMTAFSLLSVLTVQAANTQLATTQAAKTSTIPISYLPFTITAPGTYVLTANLTFSQSTGPGLSISSAAAGPIVLDLKGFTMTGDGGAGILIGYTTWGVPNSYPITIRNGTIQSCSPGIRTIAVNDYFADITVNNIIFNCSNSSASEGVEFDNVSYSTISNCVFNNTQAGIYDQNSLGGNSYNNNSFTNNAVPISVHTSGNGVLTLDRCQFGAPSSN